MIVERISELLCHELRELGDRVMAWEDSSGEAPCLAMVFPPDRPDELVLLFRDGVGFRVSVAIDPEIPFPG